MASLCRCAVQADVAQLSIMLWSAAGIAWEVPGISPYCPGSVPRREAAILETSVLKFMATVSLSGWYQKRVCVPRGADEWLCV